MAAAPPAPRRRTASASVAVRDLVVGPDHELAVAVAYTAAIHLADPDTGRIRLALVARDGVAHPHAVVLSEPGRRASVGVVRQGQRFRCGQGRVVTPAGDRIEVVRWWAPRPALGHVDAARLQEGSRRARTVLAGAAAPLDEVEAARFDALLRALRADDRHRAAHAGHGLLGLGAGSTPTGDDLLAGLIAGTVLLAPAVDVGGATHQLVDTVTTLAEEFVVVSDVATTALSGVLLRHAAVGEISQPAARVLVALTRDAAGFDAVDGAVTELLTVGSLSGRDVAYGLLAAAELVADTVNDTACPTGLAAVAGQPAGPNLAASNVSGRS